MIGDSTQVPLSPPNSPRMSDDTKKQHEFQWQPPPPPMSHAGLMAQRPPTVISPAEHSYQHPGIKDDHGRPALRSHKSFPYTFGTSGSVQHELSRPLTITASTDGPYADAKHSTAPLDLQPAPFGGSAPTSPASRLTPRSSGARQLDVAGDDEDIDLDDAEAGQEEEEERPPMTAAELRAHKRKMKRFRLTHTQTRFLMSEFARQAHPDAAHRERLSREIPGLSPRQVQVWFQNRRAKLKRLNTDDRERMMRSRALPADFDITQALHGPFGGPPTSGAPLPSPGGYGSLPDNGGVRPLTLDTLRRVPDYEQLGQSGQQYASPSGITPAIGAFGFTPPQSATSTMSSAMSSTISPTSGVAFDFQQRPGAQESPRRNMYGIPVGGQHPYPSNMGQMARMQAHERLQRPHGETISSPLRSSMSYTGPSQDNAAPFQPNRASSFSEHTSYPSERPQYARSFTNPTGPSASPYGLGFSYAHAPPYQPNESPQPNTSSAGSPQMIDMQQYRRSSGHLAGPPISSHYSYQSPAFATSHGLPPGAPYQSFQGAQFSNEDFSNPFQPEQPEQLHRLQHPPRQQHQGQQAYGGLPNQHHFVPLGSSKDQGVAKEDDEHSSDGGVALPQSY